MSRYEIDTEQHDKRNDELISLTRTKHATIMANLKARAPQTSKLIFDALAKYVEDDAALEELMLGTVDGANALQAVLNNLIWTEAEAMAVAEADREEREGSTRPARPSRQVLIKRGRDLVDALGLAHT